MTTAMAETALTQLLELLDKEDWERVAGMLADEIELADELTATWLRGRDRVAAYLRAQTGVVTDIQSQTSDTSARQLGGGDVLITFNLRQHYRLDGAERREHTTGCAIFRVEDDEPVLTLLHLGETAHADEGDDADGAPDAETREPEAVGDRIRALREAAGLSLRALAATGKLSASFLSQVERSQVDPSVSSLRRIASALGTTAPALLQGLDDHPALRTGREGERPRTALPELGMSVESFPGLSGGRLGSWITVIAPDAPSFEARAATVERFVYVLSGALAIRGDSTTILSAGEGAHLDGATPYRLASASRSALVRFLSVQPDRLDAT
jgi:transcriptional regulator with XRE-family HTH domain